MKKRKKSKLTKKVLIYVEPSNYKFLKKLVADSSFSASWHINSWIGGMKLNTEDKNARHG